MEERHGPLLARCQLDTSNRSSWLRWRDSSASSRARTSASTCAGARTSGSSRTSASASASSDARSCGGRPSSHQSNLRCRLVL